MSSARNEFVDYVVELMADWAPVMARRMFGGYGLYREGSMFALIADDQLFFKADAGNEPQFERVGSHPFVYTSQIGRVGRFLCPRGLGILSRMWAQQRAHPTHMLTSAVSRAPDGRPCIVPDRIPDTRLR